MLRQFKSASINSPEAFAAFAERAKMAQSAIFGAQPKADFAGECAAAVRRRIDGGMDSEGIATVNIVGMIAELPPAWCYWTDAVAPSMVAEVVRAYEADERCTGIRFVFDSGGGLIKGVPDLVDVIAAISKPKSAFIANGGYCCSAAYWIAANCGPITATRGAEIGCLGVYAVLWDTSKLAEGWGVPHLITTGGIKGQGEPGIPFSEEYLAFMRESVKRQGEIFLQDIVRGRGAFDAGLFNGEWWDAEGALDRGLIDDIIL